MPANAPTRTPVLGFAGLISASAHVPEERLGKLNRIAYHRIKDLLRDLQAELEKIEPSVRIEQTGPR